MNKFVKKSWSHLLLGFFSGFCAASASVSGKFAFMDGEQFNNFFIFNSLNKILGEVYLTTAIRIFMFLLLILFNMVMWTVFTKALAHSVSTIEITVCNTASNFFASAWLGVLFFGERLSAMWYVGSTFIVIGLAIIHISQTKCNLPKEKIT